MRFVLRCIVILGTCVAFTPVPRSEAAPKILTLRTEMQLVRTGFSVKNGRKRSPLYCLFRGNQRRGNPGIVVQTTRPRKFKLLSRRSSPKLSSRLAIACLSIDRPCRPVVTVEGGPVELIVGSSVSIPVSASLPASCPGTVSLQAETTAPVTAQIEGSALTIAGGAESLGRHTVTIIADNILGQRTTSVLPVTVRTAASCSPQLVVSGSRSGTENSPLELTVSTPPSPECPPLSTVTISRNASHGTLALDGGTLTYTPALHYTGEDAFALQAVNTRGERTTTEVEVEIHPTLTEFAGVVDELRPYRETLTPREVKHLLCKFALCGNETLYQYGIAHGRSALVNVLLNYDTHAATAGVREQFTTRTGASTSAEFALRVGDSSGEVSTACPSSGTLWQAYNAQFYWLAELANGDPLRNHIALHLHHMAPVNMNVNTNAGLGGGCSSHWSFKAYVDLLRVHALGQSGLPQPVTGSYREFISDLLTDYQMALFLSHVQPYTPGVGWQQGLANTNFGRELMQVFTLGPTNAITGQPNYSVNDVREVSRALAGNVNEYTENLRNVPQLQQRPWRLSNNNIGRWLEWSAWHRDAGTKTIFENIPEAIRTGDLRPSNVLDAIFSHPGLAYVPRSFFYRSVYPSTTGAVVSNLSTQFRETNFSTRDLYTRFMNSSAVFSPKARSACLATGSVHLMRTIRILGLGVTEWTGENGRWPGGTFAQLTSLLEQMGDVILAAPSIFGYGECGDTDGSPNAYNYGQGQMTTQLLLGRFNFPFYLMQYYLEGNYPYALPTSQEDFTVQQLLPPGVPLPTPDDMIRHFEDLYGVTLGSDQLRIVRSYLDPLEGGRPRWNPSNPGLVKARVANLVAIFTNLPEVNVR